jgi:lipopolysaccharide/colanic/teichoic acid biosynthesis glycosyltransferase
MAFQTAEQIKAQIEALNKQLQEQESQEKKVLKIIDDIKKAGLSKYFLTNILKSYDLIEPIVVEKKKEEKTILFIAPKVIGQKGQQFKVWKGRYPMREANKKVHEKWESITPQVFLDNLTPDGEEFFASEEGGKYFKELFNKDIKEFN